MIIIQGRNVINLVIEMIGIMICVFALSLLVFGKSRDRKTSQYFYCGFFSLLLYYVSLLLLQLFDSTNGGQWGTEIVTAGFATYFFGDLTSYIVSSYLMFALRLEKERERRLQVFLVVYMVIHMSFLFIAQASGKLATLGAQGHYLEGEWTPVGYCLVPSYMLVDVLILIIFGKNMPSGQRYAFFCYLGFPLLFSFIRIFTPGIYLIALSSSCAMMILLATILREQQQEYEDQQIREEQMKVDIMLSQIQPHFLFNALFVIQEICHEDPETASFAIGEFSRYLRHNMESLVVNRPIPFEQELDHTKHYISLQQLRFGKALDIRYDLQCTDFRLPTLTLQPIVENAIRYGIRQKEEGEGTVFVNTAEHEDRFEVIVEDNGPGFQPSAHPQDGLTHVGLDNVRERLSRICGGTLLVDSVPGTGTRVTMMIPREN